MQGFKAKVKKPKIKAKDLDSSPQLKAHCFRKICFLNSQAQIYKLTQHNYRFPFKFHYSTDNYVKKIISIALIIK